MVKITHYRSSFEKPSYECRLVYKLSMSALQSYWKEIHVFQEESLLKIPKTECMPFLSACCKPQNSWIFHIFPHIKFAWTLDKKHTLGVGLEKNQLRYLPLIWVSKYLYPSFWVAASLTLKTSGFWGVCNKAKQLGGEMGAVAKC